MNTKIDIQPAILILTGNDSLAKENRWQKFIENVKNTCGQCQMINFDSAEEKIPLFLQKIITPSMFGEPRIFFIRHIQSLSPGDLQEINRYLNYELTDDIRLIIEGEEKATGEKNSFVKALKLKERSSDPRIAVETFAKPPDYAIDKWLVSNIGSLFSRSISLADAAYLVDQVGYDLNVLYSELRKIDIHLPPRAAVNREIITEITGSSRSMTVYELANAIGEKQLPRTLEIIDSLFSYKFYAPLMINALFRHFWALYRIKRFCRSNPDVFRKLSSSDYSTKNQAAATVGIAAGLLSEKEKKRAYPVILKSGIVNQAGNFSTTQLRQIIKMLFEFDTGVKSGRINPDKNMVLMFCSRIIKIEHAMSEAIAL